MLVFYILAALSIWLGIVSVRGGLRFRSYVQREVAQPLTDYAPFVSVIAPFRGMDQGLRENLAALFQQNYPAFEILFVTDRADDPALALVEDVRGSAGPSSGVASRVIVAGAASDCGQKVHNLRAAVLEVGQASEVLVFVDTDARPHADWLRSLVSLLSDERVGAATGYRWFIPRYGLASHLRSVWNASTASALGANAAKNFCWGGSTAIRRTTFERMNVAERWRGTVSDDFTLTLVLHEAKLPIQFVPACLTASFDDCSSAELIEFTTRQLKITRVYAPHLWRAVLLGSSIFVLVFFGGIALVTTRALLKASVVIPAILLGIMFLLGATKAWIRLRAVGLAMRNYELSFGNQFLSHLLLWPLASVLFLWNGLAAAASRRINWRGIEYELKSPTEAVIIAREK